MFVDRIKIFAQAGKGGRGCASFRREKFVPKGGPDGGDGGRGGDVILRADRHVDNLANLFYEPIIKAKDGGHGMGKKMSGRAGADKVVKIPVGTVVWRGEQTMPMIPSELEASHEITSTAPWQDSSTSHGMTGAEVVADLTRDGQDFVLCRGGAGGKGNVHFKSSRNRAPRQYTEGEEGEQGQFLFELRTIADVGLVGYPNAGKSTLLRKISAARPKVAAYPFTTLHPIVGVIEFPGSRCHLLIFVVDIAGSEGRNPVEDLQNLRRELDLYDRTLSSRPWLVVANKMDLPGATENLKALQARFPKVQILPTAAATGKGIAALKHELATRMTNEVVSAAI